MLSSISANQSFAIELWSTTKSQQDASIYRSWLASASGEPVSVEMEEVILTGKNYVDKVASALNLSLTPLATDASAKEILTRIKLSYQSSTGESSDVTTTAWLTENGSKPVAIVLKQVELTQGIEKEFFALVVGAKVIPATALPDQKPVLTYSDVEGIRQFITGGVDQQAENGNLQAQLALETGKLTSAPRLLGQMNLPIKGNLRLATQLEADFGSSTRAIVSCGLSDETKLIDNLTLNATCYLAQFDLTHGSFYHIPVLQASLKLSQPYGSLWISGEYSYHHHYTGIGAELMATSKLGVKAQYSWESDHSRQLRLGVFLKYHH